MSNCSCNISENFVNKQMSRKAVIDLGTNTCNLLIADTFPDGSFSVIYDRKLPVKLGRGGIHKEILLPEAIQRGISAFQGHAQVIKDYGADEVKVIATSAMRGASNSDQFISKIKELFGWQIEVIDGEREAELIFEGVRLSLPEGLGKYMIVDIGGGSIEFILANEDKMIWKRSFNVGIARVLELFVISDPVRPDEIAEIENWFDENLKELWEIIELYQPSVLVGCSGAFDTFMDIYEEVDPDLKIREASEFPLNEFRRIHHQLIESESESRSRMKGMDKIRVEMIVIASVFTNFILRKAGIKTLIHTHYALKEGVMREFYFKQNITSSMTKILVIDDERSIRSTLKEILGFEGHSIDVAENGISGLELIKSKDYDIVLCDIKMPEMDGIEVLRKIMEIKPETTVVMISGHGNIDTAVEAIKLGAYDFIVKPLDLNRLLITIRNAGDKSVLIKETKILKQKVNKGYEIIGESPQIKKILETTDRVAPTEARVLITGPSGSGKELVARRLHDNSPRAEGPFIEVNCAAIPSELIESELFGHEKGAFTSAIKQRKGKFEQADGGTLFLDEIGDMSLSAQSKVLRALQESIIVRVGNDTPIKVNVRVIAATNKDLMEEIKKGYFREDLYHRLSVILIHVPSLDNRKEDIPLLANHFIKQICADYGQSPKDITQEAIEELQSHNWTGNIREFRNVIERLIILSDKIITPEDVKLYVSNAE